MRVLVTPDYRTLSLAAAEIVADTVRLKPDLVLGLPTGNTPAGMYDELVRKYRDGRADFSRIRTFNLDEYIGLTEDDPASFQMHMRRLFFDHVNVAAQSIHFPDECYEETIRSA